MRFDLVIMTGRQEPLIEGILDSLVPQLAPDDQCELLVIDALGRDIRELDKDHASRPFSSMSAARPKPNPWQGPHRITDREWWATSNSRCTAIVLAKTDYIAFLDDRCTVGPKWLQTIRRYHKTRDAVVCGSYDKIEGPPDALKKSEDHRRGIHPKGKINCGGGWLYGCTFALPLAWALDVNGFEEGCDGLTGEDYIFGLMLGNAGHRIDFAPDLYVLQDRTAGNETCKGSYACRDKGVSPNDKSHAALERFGKRKRTEFTPDLRQLRAQLADGTPWPLPDPDLRDWFDGEFVRDMKPSG